MSHFVVIVVGPDYERQLEPYNENDEGVFNDKTAEVTEEYKEGARTMIRMPDGTYQEPYNSMFKNPNYDHFGDSDEEQFIYPEECVEEKCKFCDVYDTLDEFVTDWHGYEKEDGVYGYWHNPNAKWDWYVMGGRWRGYFRVKAGATAKVGESGAFGNAAEPGGADQLRIKDIDFDGAYKEAEDKANEMFDEWEKLINEHDPKHETQVWRTFAVRIGTDEEDSLTRDEARELYRAQPLMKAINEKENHFSSFWGCPVEEMGFNREEYVKSCRDAVMVPHAILYNGEWYQHGEMGWWGIVRDEKDQETWNSQFHKMFRQLPEDTLVTAVDCHI